MKELDPFPELDERRRLIAELTCECPVNKDNPADCPLANVRKLSPEERRKWVQDLPESEVNYLIAYHHLCLRTKFEYKFPSPSAPKTAKPAA